MSELTPTPKTPKFALRTLALSVITLALWWFINNENFGVGVALNKSNGGKMFYTGLQIALVGATILSAILAACLTPEIWGFFVSQKIKLPKVKNIEVDKLPIIGKVKIELRDEDAAD